MKVHFTNRLLIFIITGLRPLFGFAQCRYTVTCTQFALMQLKEKKMIPAIWAIIKRILSCNPFF